MQTGEFSVCQQEYHPRSHFNVRGVRVHHPRAPFAMTHFLLHIGANANTVEKSSVYYKQKSNITQKNRKEVIPMQN